MHDPLWLEVLRKHCFEGDGLTIPVLVAAQSMETEKPPQSTDVTAIINSMQDDTTNGFYISFCRRLGAPVVTVIPSNYGKGLRLGMPLDYGASEEDQLKQVILETKRVVQDGHFSRTSSSDGYSWTNLNPEDQLLIESVKRRTIPGI